MMAGEDVQTDSDLNWYVVLTKPRQENRAQRHLAEQGSEVFLPLLTVEKLRNGKRLTQQEVMFPGYLFLRCRAQSPLLNKVRSTPGARMLLRFGNEPVVVFATLVDNLRDRLEQDETTLFSEQQSVRITSGPFKDYQALFKQYDGEQRAIVLINLLNKQQELLVELNHLSA